jgi:polyisoprenyl-phosphate glycosyltransferase
MASGSLLVAFGYLVAKLVFWNLFTVGVAPILISLFFFSSVLLFFIGIIGEYIGAIHTQVQKRPLVIEKERLNFDEHATPHPVPSRSIRADSRHSQVFRPTQGSPSEMQPR